MGGPTRQRQAASTTPTQSEQSSAEQDVEAIDPSAVDPEEIVKTDDGELMHEPTGLILEDEQIDHGPEWRSFTQSERDEKSRVGSPMTEMMHDRGLTTTIGWQNKVLTGGQSLRRSELKCIGCGSGNSASVRKTPKSVTYSKLSVRLTGWPRRWGYRMRPVRWPQ